MGAQFYSKTNLNFFSFFSRSTSKLAKGAQRSKTNVLPKIQCGYKNAEFYADFEPLKTLQKIHAKNVVITKRQKNRVVLLLLL
jgi:hypothetical protein